MIVSKPSPLPSYLHVPVLPVVELGEVDRLEDGADGNGPNDASLCVAARVQLVVGLPGDQDDQLPEKEAKAAVDEHLQADVAAEVRVQLNAPVEVKDGVAVQVVLAGVGQNEAWLRVKETNW